MVVQRGDRGARRGRQHDPADLRGRPRDRRDADRLRLRQARADADRRRRNGGAGARRPDRRADEQGAPRAGLLAARAGRPPHRAARAARALPTPRSCWRSRASGSTTCAERLPRALRANAQIHHTQFSRVAGRLSPQLLAQPGRAPPRAARRRDAPARHRAQDLPRDAARRASRARRERVTALSASARERAVLALIASRDARLERSYQLLRGVLLSERARARLCAGARRRRPSAALRRVGAARHARSTSNSPTAASARRPKACGTVAPRPPSRRTRARPPHGAPRKKGSAGGDPGQGSLFGDGRSDRAQRRPVRPSARADLSVHHRDVGALLLLRHARAARAVHGEAPVPARQRARP